MNTIFFRNSVYLFYQLPDLVVEPFIKRQAVVLLPSFDEHPAGFSIGIFDTSLQLVQEDEEPTF
ncbi:hypothetical protein EEL36_04580 [Muribaculaceae bacterium Isolate-043 (Harlan)]|nr:hypothetical protein EEL36_04580 [Muribaculaceae bacterium Isolate-043 (Harlan)]